MRPRRCPKCNTCPIVEQRDYDLKYELRCNSCGWAPGFPDSDEREAIANWNIMAVGYKKPKNKLMTTEIWDKEAIERIVRDFRKYPKWE